MTKVMTQSRAQDIMSTSTNVEDFEAILASHAALLRITEAASALLCWLGDDHVFFGSASKPLVMALSAALSESTVPEERPTRAQLLRVFEAAKLYREKERNGPSDWILACGEDSTALDAAIAEAEEGE